MNPGAMDEELEATPVWPVLSVAVVKATTSPLVVFGLYWAPLASGGFVHSLAQCPILPHRAHFVLPMSPAFVHLRGLAVLFAGLLCPHGVGGRGA